MEYRLDCHERTSLPAARRCVSAPAAGRRADVATGVCAKKPSVRIMCGKPAAVVAANAAKEISSHPLTTTRHAVRKRRAEHVGQQHGDRRRLQQPRHHGAHGPGDVLGCSAPPPVRSLRRRRASWMDTAHNRPQQADAKRHRCTVSVPIKSAVSTRAVGSNRLMELTYNGGWAKPSMTAHVASTSAVEPPSLVSGASQLRSSTAYRTTHCSSDRQAATSCTTGARAWPSAIRVATRHVATASLAATATSPTAASSSTTEKAASGSVSMDGQCAMRTQCRKSCSLLEVLFVARIHVTAAASVMSASLTMDSSMPAPPSSSCGSDDSRASARAATRATVALSEGSTTRSALAATRRKGTDGRVSHGT